MRLDRTGAPPELVLLGGGERETNSAGGPSTLSRATRPKTGEKGLAPRFDKVAVKGWATPPIPLQLCVLHSKGEIMKTVMQVLFGLVLGMVGIGASLNLGFLVHGQPDWRTGVIVLFFLAATQWVAYFSFRHHLAIQVLFGLAWSAMLSIAWLYLGPFWESMSPDGNSYALTWRSDLALVLLVAATQWISVLVFRRRIALPVFIGLLLCVVLAIPLLRSEAAFSWEKHLPEGTFTIGWRSDMLFLFLVAATQGVSFLAFRWIRRDGRRPPTGGTVRQPHG